MHHQSKDVEQQPKADLFGLLFYRTVILSQQRDNILRKNISKPARLDARENHLNQYKKNSRL